MAKNNCVLCGKELGWMDKLTLSVFDTEQFVCSDCDRTYRAAPPARQEELRQIILDSPHLTDRATVEDYQRSVAGKTCPACGGGLERKLKNFSIGADGYGGLTSMGLPDYQVDLYSCTRCGRVELYTSNFKTMEEQAEEGPAFVICPECGKEHSPSINCPACAVRAAASGRRMVSSSASAKKDKKPPWER